MSHSQSRFDCLVYAPSAHRCERLLVATARANACAVLDICFTAHTDPQNIALQSLIAALARLQPGEHRIGIRAPREALGIARTLVEAAKAQSFNVTLIISLPDTNTTADDCIKAISAVRADEILFEISDIATAREYCQRLPANTGIILTGAEAGGHTGTTAAFLLAQQIGDLKQIDPERAIYIRGAIGPKAALACALAGADGIALSDEVLLFPDSPIPHTIRATLERLDGTETIVAGETFNHPARFLFLPNQSTGKSLKEAAEHCETSTLSDNEKARYWRDSISTHLSWHDRDDAALPIGQGIMLANSLLQKYRTVGRLIGEILSSHETLRTISRDAAAVLAPNAPMAKFLSTTTPIVQGPMTRVSDEPAFAAAVSNAGALPSIALAVMDAAKTESVLAETKKQIGSKPWAVGILGFAEPDLLSAQLKAVAKARPQFAILAGGRPDQYRELLDLKIAPFLHAPAPRLVRLFARQGVRHFVLEGRECGGHVGPVHSFPLWEMAINELATINGRAPTDTCNVLFAGGIHNELSAAMVAVMAAPLHQQGHRIGLLIGTAYLATTEAVNENAITPSFQQSVLDARATATLKSAPGHANRCLVTPYVEEFNARRATLLTDGVNGDDLRNELDAFLLGRLRIATKGLARNDNALEPVTQSEQLSQGMYMAGDVATQITKVRSLDELHDELTTRAASRLSSLANDARPKPAKAHPCDIAVIGMSLTLPGAPSPQHFWRNVVAKKSAITEVPKSAWDWRLYYDADAKTGDKSVSRWGGFFEPVEVDPLRFGIPPATIPSTSPAQLLTLELAQRALDDAGYGDGGFNREQTSVIVAAADSAGLLGNQLIVRTMLPLVSANERADLTARLPEWKEETFPGTITSVVAGRVANRLDLGGANYTVDAACASGLTALALAANELVDGRADMSIVAAIDSSQTPHHYVAFSNTGALSPTGSARVFDKSADGTVISEGAVVMVLKRLQDAQRDGDRIYGVIKGAANSSDGKGLGLTAPRPIGQRRALVRAYDQAAISPSDITYYEAHGTGTPVGDQAELTTISKLLNEHEAHAHSCAIGSVKSLIGHTKTAAGLASLAKVLLALHHRVLPPHDGVKEPISDLADKKSPVYLLDKPRPWISTNGKPRRAGVSAFGFGGTNCHAVIEEYTGSLECPSTGGDIWPSELIVLTGKDATAIIKQATTVRKIITGHKVSLVDIAYTLAQIADAAPTNEMSVCFTGDTLKALDADLEILIKTNPGDLASKSKLPAHMSLSHSRERAPKTAFLFPGQGAQALFMGHEAALFLPEVFDTIDAADTHLADRLPHPLSATIYPQAAFTHDARVEQDARLKDTQMAQPAIGALSLGLVEFLRRLGVNPDMAAGHSYGEYVALAAARAMSHRDLFDVSAARGHAMSGATNGTMAALLTDLDEAHRLIEPIENVCIANINGPSQVVISGPTEAIDTARERAKAAGVQCQPLPVSGAFHSKLMENACNTFARDIARLDLQKPDFPVFANLDGRCFPSDPDRIRAKLSSHMVEPVNYVEQVRALHNSGAQVFIEVGPGRNLTNLAKQILNGESNATFISLDGRRIKDLLGAIAGLWIAGCKPQLSNLFKWRNAQTLNLQKLASTQAPVNQLAWMVSGTKAIPIDPQSRFLDKTKTLLDSQSAQAERAHAHQVASSAQLPTPATSQGQNTMKTGDTNPPSSNAVPPRTTSQPHTAPNDNRAVLEAYQAHQETMRHFLATQERVLNMFLNAGTDASTNPQNHIAGISSNQRQPAPQSLGIPEINTTTAANPPRTISKLPETKTQPTERENTTPPEPTDTKKDQPELTEAGISNTLIDLVSQVTGYPTDMINVSQDIEAELGIDSIKRLEILECLQQELPAAITARLQEKLATISRMRTLSEWIDAIISASAQAHDAPEKTTPATKAQSPPTSTPTTETEPLPASTRVPTPTPDTQTQAHIVRAHPPSRNETPLADNQPAPSKGCPRYLMVPRPAPTSNIPRDHLSGLYIIAAGNDLLARFVANGLNARGATPLTISYDDLTDTDTLRRRIDKARQQNGPVRAIIHMAGTRPWKMPSTLTQWRDDAARTAKSLFHCTQEALNDLLKEADGKYGRIVSVTALGGTFGRDHTRPGGSPLAGASQGMLKSLSIEHPQLMTKCIDVDPSIPIGTTALQIVDECALWGGRIEIGFPRAQRTVFDIEPAPLSKPAQPEAPLLPDGAVVVVTGGAKGITAATLCRLARPGMKLVLIGRSNLPKDEPTQIANCQSHKKLREHFVKAAKATRTNATPAEIEAQVTTALSAREIRTNINKLKNTGAQVEYHAVDIKNANETNTLIAGVRERFGTIHALIHGAGIIEDKLFADKKPESFDRVFDTKVDGLFNICNALGTNSPTALILFSSIAGRFGNKGQADYGAANEVLNRLAFHFAQAWPTTKVVSFNWGPWAGAGMAIDAVNDQFRARGIAPIPLEEGTRFVINQLHTNDAIEVIAGVGHWSAGLTNEDDFFAKPTLRQAN